MPLQIILLIAGLALLIAGGDILVRGAIGAARLLGVSTLLIGLTVVAFGTSAPELAVNLFAALQGNSDVSFGNIVGSNIANIGLILGAAALITPLTIKHTIAIREIPMMLLATVALFIMGLDTYLRSAAAVNEIDRAEGLLLLMLFGVFLYYTISEALRQRSDKYLAQMSSEIEQTEKPASMGLSLLLLVGGLVAVSAGGKLTVDAAVYIAEAVGISQTLIGLTIVALGTSLPELATSIMAARRGHADIAIGNVVGSNIFNILFVLSITATAHPVAIPVGGFTDLIALALLSFALLPIAFIGKNIVSRFEGLLLLVAYIGYILYRTFGMPAPIA
ncbi:MAG: calcium/sodium antiporter [Planctomycetes bacterium]|nr:calcium/sodium antiporter [Planctomycetota bacterium]